MPLQRALSHDRDQINVCVVQLNLRSDDKDPVAEAGRWVCAMERIQRQQTIIDLFVLPELAPLGYSEDTFARFLPICEHNQQRLRKIDQLMQEAARRLRAFICYGKVGRLNTSHEKHRLTIRQVVLNRQGEVIATYDKTHLCDYGTCSESRFFVPGMRQGQPVSFAVDGFRFGLLICADMRYPLLARRLAREHRVDVLLQPAAFNRDLSFRTWQSFRETRAVENSCYFVGVNYAGTLFGQSSIVPPWVDENHEPIVLGTREDCLVRCLSRVALDKTRTQMPFYKEMMRESQAEVPLERHAVVQCGDGECNGDNDEHRHDSGDNDESDHNHENTDDLSNDDTDDNEPNPFDVYMQRGAHLQRLRAMALQDEAERQQQSACTTQSSEIMPHPSTSEEALLQDTFATLPTGQRVLRYDSYLRHQRYYDDLKHIDYPYIDFGTFGPDAATRLVVEQDKTLGKGGLCWDAAHILGEHVIDLFRQHPPLATRPQRVVELGCGTGLCGMMLAKAIAGMQVYLTDLPVLMPLLERNVARNFEKVLESSCWPNAGTCCRDDEEEFEFWLGVGIGPHKASPSFVAAQVMDWTEVAHARADVPKYDYILGADVVASLYDPVALARTIHALAHKDSVVLLTFKERLSTVHRQFEEALGSLFDEWNVEDACPNVRNRNPNVKVIRATRPKKVSSIVN